MKRFNVWILVAGTWSPFDSEDADELKKVDWSRSDLSERLAATHKRGTYKIRLAA